MWTNPYKRMQLEDVAERIRQWQQDKLIMNGRRAFLYQPVLSTTSGVVACTCRKATNITSDATCLQCYGVGYAPGYLRFAHSTIWATVSNYAAGEVWTLTDVQLDTTVRPHMLVLADGELTGTVVTTGRAFTNPVGTTATVEASNPLGPADWTTQVDIHLRTPTGSTAVTEFSTNGGGTWTNITAINGVNRPTGTGTILFRVTLTRASVDDEGPAFEAIRIRRPLFENANPLLTQQRRVASARNPASEVSNYEAGEILLLRTFVAQQMGLQATLGRGEEHQGDRGWTAPMDLFDTTISPNTPEARIREDEGGWHPFYQHTSGILTDRRYVMSKINYSDELTNGIFTAQSWDDRRAQNHEPPYALVW